MAEKPDKEVSVLAFIFAVLLLATGIVALPVGLFLLLLGDLLYAGMLLGYGVIALLIAMYGSDRSVIFVGAGLYFPLLFPLPTRERKSRKSTK